ncbi:hypothetical protein ATI61_10513 [Archangium gephyra]|uniref:Uncharacterized protein n=1 Tax=Archangium gephyra TaxID=48 RepID=A0AAC8QH72_9BACT|nr:hypothetical protein [Archangium gephyra]AKJ07025.1 Hypothetical protein AA314_08651 [Archangium gephyra]REG31689.1 hypothetical protein ATI61_10513 [Archangium gephyra]
MKTWMKSLSTFALLFTVGVAQQAHAVIVIYNSSGGCAICIGSPAACRAACPEKAALQGFKGDIAVALPDGREVVGNTVVVNQKDGDLGVVSVSRDSKLIFEGYVPLYSTVVTDLETGHRNNLGELAAVSSCQ